MSDGNGNGKAEMAEIRALVIECARQNLALGQRLDQQNAAQAQRMDFLGQRLDQQNAAQAQRMDSLCQRLDETNSRIDRKVDSFVQTVSAWREEIRQQQSQLLAIHRNVMEKLDRLPEDVRERIGFGVPVPESGE